MGTPEHIRRLRQHVGHDLLLLPTVAAFIRRRDGCVLVVRLRAENRWTLPGGLVELGEAPADAVIREIREECGVEIEPLSVLGVFGGDGFRRTYLNGDRIESFEILFECRIAGASVACADDEIAETAFKRPEELLDWLHPVTARSLCEAADCRRTLVKVAGVARLLGTTRSGE